MHIFGETETSEYMELFLCGFKVMSSMINLKASHKTPTININANPVTNVHVTNRGSDGTTTTVQYPPADQCVMGPGITYPNAGQFQSVAPQAVSSFTSDMSAFQSDDPEKARLMRENAVLKLIIDIQHSNPLIVNKYIIADDETLVKMVALLCNATEVHIDADDVGRGCISKNTYRKVHSIYVVVDGQTMNLKYHFSDVMKILKDLHISTKYVF